MRIGQALKQFDWLLMTGVIILVITGLIIIYSTTVAQSSEDDYQLIIVQIVAFIIGAVLVAVLGAADYRIFKNYAYFIYILALLLLIGVLIFGQNIRGTKGWFDFGVFQVQPAELAKLALLFILAKYFASVSGRPSRFQFIIVSALFTLVPVSLIMIQPDMGSALVLIVMWLGMLLFSGVKKIHLFILALSGVAVSVTSWIFILKDYQKERLISFLNPTRDPLGSGYNLIQSKIAVGSGGIFGRGLGRGTQSQLKFLPEQHTDFIFAVLAEELGFIGSLILIGLFSFVMFRLIRVAQRAKDEFGIMIAIGGTIILSFQFFINIGMNLSILPVTGLTLPFISYGGSSMIAIMILIGLIQSVAIRSRKLVFS